MHYGGRTCLVLWKRWNALPVAINFQCNAARAGGVLYPIVRSLSSAFKSEPETSPRRVGSYLMQEKGAWDTLIWMGALVGLAGQLAKSGFIKWFSTSVGSLGWKTLGLW